MKKEKTCSKCKKKVHPSLLKFKTPTCGACLNTISKGTETKNNRLVRLNCSLCDIDLNKESKRTKYRSNLCDKCTKIERKTYHNLYKEVNLKRQCYYRVNNKEKVNEYQYKYVKERKKTDPFFKLKCNIRNRLSQFYKQKGWDKNSKTFALLGTSPLELRTYLENKFKDGMNWDNYGEWHIDHIIPLSLAKTQEELYLLCHYSNLQPLWAIENLKKGNRI